MKNNSSPLNHLMQEEFQFHKKKNARGKEKDKKKTMEKKDSAVYLPSANQQLLPERPLVRRKTLPEHQTNETT